MPAASFRGAFPGVAAFLLAAVGLPAFRLTTLLDAQVETPRMLGVLALLAAALLVVAAALTALVVRLPVWSAGWRRAAEVALVGVTAVSAAGAGILIYFGAVWRTPKGWLAAAALVPVLLAVRLATLGPAERALFVRPLRALAVALLTLPILTTPYVAWDAAHHDPRVPGTPVAPVGAAVRPDAPARVVLITFDALQMQSTGLFDPTLDTTPNLQALAAQGTAFTGARAPADLTVFATPAILSGIPPGRVTRPDGKIGLVTPAGSLTGLAAHLAPAGYVAGAFTNTVDVRTIGFDGEFAEAFNSAPSFRPNTFNVRPYLPIAPTLDWLVARATFKPDLPDPRLAHPPFAAREVFTRGLDFVDRHRAGRSFSWIHVGVPHMPVFDVPPPGRLDDPMRRLPSFDTTIGRVPKDVTLERFRRVYRNYLRFGDAELGRFLAGLKARGLYEDALILVSADHGEFVAIDKAVHGTGLLGEEVAHVPLVVRVPGGAPARRDERLASTIDIAPTVLERVYQAVPTGFPGRSLAAPAAPDRAVHTWAMYGKLGQDDRYGGTIATYQGRWRYVAHWPAHTAAPTEALADLAADPAGQVDVAAKHPDVVARLRAIQRQDNPNSF